jgi:pilus assembly protein CpaE
MQEKILTVRLDVRNPAIMSELESIVSSMEAFQLVTTSATTPCDILIRDIGEDKESDFRFLHEMTRGGTVGEFFLTSPDTSGDLLLRALRAGAKEFLPQPIQEEEVRHCLRKALERKERDTLNQSSRKPGVIIDVLGSKGGVGTTTTAVNLSASLNRLNDNRSVALIDMNLLFGEVPLFLDIKPAFNWGEIVKNIARLDASYLMGVMVKHKSGIHVLPPPTQLNGAGVTEPEVLETLLRLMQEEFDYIVIDGGQSLDSLSLKILELTDMVLLMSILSLPCLINTRRLLETFTSLGYPPRENIRVVVNRYHKKAGISTGEAEEGIQEKIAWRIPNDFHTAMSSINQGKLVMDVAKKSELATGFMNMAAAIMKDLAEEEKEKGFLKFR